MVLDNDTRGWIMTCVSGIACVVGSSIICVDLIVQQIPGKRSFRIQDSSAFLSSSLSLSFGVMIYSSLYRMLPSAQRYLSEGGLSPSAAAYAVIGCFLSGVVGIQLVSRILHHYIPSHVVDCDHTHHEEETDDHNHTGGSHHHGHAHKHNGFANEHTPLMSRSTPELKPGLGQRSMYENEPDQSPDTMFLTVPTSKRPTFQTRLTNRVTTFVSGAKASCDESGPCYGYSDPCGRECLKTVSRNPITTFGRAANAGLPDQPPLIRTMTAPHGRPGVVHSDMIEEEPFQVSGRPTFSNRSTAAPSKASANHDFRGREGYRPSSPGSIEQQSPGDLSVGQNRDKSIASEDSAANEASHHHHVPGNAFLAIGLQTSIAIALHKLPEGFITYATNHANPKLGFSVFMALFIHNITEGFAMALPLYLAINSRWKAMFWSALLGGVSQPLGAGIAALWFKLARRNDSAPGDIVYGCMFSITAGIMASVALQLFSESLSLTHHRSLCTTFAFIGMGILGVSFALTA